VSWVKRVDTGAKHVCAAPDAQNIDDLWRCDDAGCRKLWRVAWACGVCDANGGRHQLGQCRVGVTWRPAHPGQLLRNWRKG
jgi:hypothetical protein